MDKKYHHGDLKIQLIKSGLQMIQEDGINKLSLRRLAQMCNVSEAAPYSHFKNKEELLIAIQEYVTEQLLKCLQDAYEKTEHCNSPIAILNMGKAYVKFFIKYPEYYNAYIAMAQTCNQTGSEYMAYDYMKAKYEQLGSTKWLRNLRIIPFGNPIKYIKSVLHLPCVTKPCMSWVLER